MSVLRRDGVPRQQAATHDGAALSAARRRKERVYPVLTGEMGRTRLVVLAGEVGGHWSEESREFLNQLAKAKARREPRPGVAAQMGISLGLQRGQSLCPFPVGAQERPGV